ncbi:MAG TPA: hypothetical protein VFT70_10070 [Nocardioides sp.]|nr:hypothetical protein [Nocardioides sp.]
MRRRAAVCAVAAATFAGVHHWGRTYGATRAERRASMPGDDLVADPQVVATHAATLPAPPARVWPWLVQVGWHRGGWYTPRWVDVLLFPDNWPSADRLLPEHAALVVGDRVPDGPPETACFFTVREVEAPRLLVLESSTHLPLRWRERGLARLSLTWSFTLEPVDHGRRTRLVLRWRARTAPFWVTAGAHLLIVPADLVMTRGMLRGLRRRVAGDQAG